MLFEYESSEVDLSALINNLVKFRVNLNGDLSIDRMIITKLNDIVEGSYRLNPNHKSTEYTTIVDCITDLTTKVKRVNEYPVINSTDDHDELGIVRDLHRIQYLLTRYNNIVL